MFVFELTLLDLPCLKILREESDRGEKCLLKHSVSQTLEIMNAMFLWQVARFLKYEIAALCCFQMGEISSVKLLLHA